MTGADRPPTPAFERPTGRAVTPVHTSVSRGGEGRH